MVKLLVGRSSGTCRLNCPCPLLTVPETVPVKEMVAKGSISPVVASSMDPKINSWARMTTGKRMMAKERSRILNMDFFWDMDAMVLDGVASIFIFL